MREKDLISVEILGVKGGVNTIIREERAPLSPYGRQVRPVFVALSAKACEDGEASKICQIRCIGRRKESVESAGIWSATSTRIGASGLTKDQKVLSGLNLSTHRAWTRARGIVARGSSGRSLIRSFVSKVRPGSTTGI